MSASPTGLRERKKQQTRDAISATATRLFAAQGFEKTTIAEVAEAANVSKMTVTNHFPLKEDLVFDRAGEIVDMVAGAIAARPPEMSALEALERAYEERLVGRNPILGFIGRRFAELVGDSPALAARERAIFDQQEAALADALTAEMGLPPAEISPRIAAAQLSAVFRVQYYEGRRRLLADEPTDEIEAALRACARTSFDQVRDGLPAALTEGRSRPRAVNETSRPRAGMNTAAAHG
jgi:AcrR family transcriptional regulator